VMSFGVMSIRCALAQVSVAWSLQESTAYRPELDTPQQSAATNLTQVRPRCTPACRPLFADIPDMGCHGSLSQVSFWVLKH
jgi:hypothetical protein